MHQGSEIKEIKLANLRGAPRCSAKSKRSQKGCLAPAVRGRSVCRMHGGKAGAPFGERNGSFKTGLHTNELVEIRREVACILRAARNHLRMLKERDAE